MNTDEKYFSFVSRNDELSEEVSSFLKTLSSQRGKILCKAMSEAMAGKTRFLQLTRKQRTLNTNYKINVDTRDIKIKSQLKTISTRLYLPSETIPNRVLLYLHGGGWVIGSPDSCEKICANLCEHLNCAVFAFDYSLAPETKFPEPIQECTDAFLEMIEIAKQWNISNDKIFICGDSSGGNLALATIIKLLETKRAIPSAIALFYPVTNISDYNQDDSWKNFGDCKALESDVMESFIKCYINDDSDRLSSLASPILHDDFSDFPPTLIISSGRDILHDQCKNFAKKFRQTNPNIRYVELQNATHIYATMDGMDMSYSIGLSEVENFIKRF